MGLAYRKHTGQEGKGTTDPEMRLFCQRPGKKDGDGNPIYFTEQQHKRECDINYIIEKHDKMGIITHISRFEGKFGDISGLEFKEYQDKIAGAKSMFESLPAQIKKEFKNSPAELLSFMDDENNRDKAIELGLINENWTDDSDGLGEYIRDGENKFKNEKITKKENEKETEKV